MARVQAGFGLENKIQGVTKKCIYILEIKVFAILISQPEFQIVVATQNILEVEIVVVV